MNKEVHISDPFVANVSATLIYLSVLTHHPLVMHFCVSESAQHWFRQWPVAYSAPWHYLDQSWVFVNWNLRHKLQWNFKQNTKCFIHENVSENIVCVKAAIVSRGKWANALLPQRLYKNVFVCVLPCPALSFCTHATQINEKNDISKTQQMKCPTLKKLPRRDWFLTGWITS